MPNRVLNDRIRLICGDITKLRVHAIVNAANTRLMGGGGVDGAIWSAAGHAYLRTECGKLGGCETGKAKMTGGGKLPAKHIIHTVGPVYSALRDEQCAALLRSCYRTCVELAQEAGLSSIAFPCISTGVYGYPRKQAAELALTEVRRSLEATVEDRMLEVVFCTYSAEDENIYKEVIP